MVALRVREAEGAFFEDGVVAVPQAESQADGLLFVADAAHSVLVPAVGPRNGVLEREVGPGVAVRRVVFADGAPGPSAR